MSKRQHWRVDSAGTRDRSKYQSNEATAIKGRSKTALERSKVVIGNLAARTEYIDMCDS